MITTEERIKNIQRHKEEKDKEKKSKNELCHAKNLELIRQIVSLQDRIGDLIDVANSCLKNDIPLVTEGSSYRKAYENGYYLASGISHRVGFETRNGIVTSVSILGEGGYSEIVEDKYYSDLDFHVTRNTIECIDNRKEMKGVNHIAGTIKPTNWIMEKFLKDFYGFEKSFYEYVDGIVG